MSRNAVLLAVLVPFALSAEVRLSGTVVLQGETSEPVPGASVVLLRPDVPVIYPPKATQATLEYVVVDSVLTDSTGRFSFPGLVEGIYLLRITKKQHDSFEAQFEVRDDLDITVRTVRWGTMGSLEGVVYGLPPPGEPWVGPAPLAGCTVCVYTQIPDTNPVYSMGYIRVTHCVVTDSVGYYHIDSLFALSLGGWSARARHPAYLTTDSLARVRTDSTTTLDYLLERTYTHLVSTVSDSIEYILASERPVYESAQAVTVRYGVYNGSLHTFPLEFSLICGPRYFRYAVLSTQGDTLIDAYALDCRQNLARFVVSPWDTLLIGAATFTLTAQYDTVLVSAFVPVHPEMGTLTLPVVYAQEQGTMPRAAPPPRAPLSLRVVRKEVVVSLAAPGPLRVRLFTLSGRQVAILADKAWVPAGEYRLRLPRGAGSVLLCADIRGRSTVERICP